MRFVIYAYESTYCGLHGIYNICVTEADSLDELDDIGETMAYEVIDSYSHLFANDEEDYDENEEYEATSPEWEYARILPKWDNIPTNALDAEAAKLGYEEFVDKYCKVEGMDELIAALDVLRQEDWVGHTTVGKYTVETYFVKGEDYETAIWIDLSRVAIPAVYPNRAAAEQGHKFWCLAAAMAPTQVWDTVTKTYITL